MELPPSEKGTWHRTATIVELGVGFPRKRKFLEAGGSDDRWLKGRFSGGEIRVAGAIDDGEIYGNKKRNVFFSLFASSPFWYEPG